MVTQSSGSSLSELGLTPDAGLDKVLRIAGHVGDMSHDDVNISYTSLLIGLLWGDDPTSLWMQRKAPMLGARLDAVYGQRGLTGGEREKVLEKVASGVTYSKREDEVSISARTVLRDARSVANESGVLATQPIGTRHVAAVYFFRNPPGHNRQLHVEWGFDPERWRKAFADYIVENVSTEVTAWAPVLGGYLTTEPAAQTVSGTALAAYMFDTDALSLVRTAEQRALAGKPAMMRSEDLLQILAGAKTIRDCVSFGELVGYRVGDLSVVLTSPTPLTAGVSVGATRGFKNILDRARNLTRATTRTDTIGVRHLIASLIAEPDSTANRRLVDAGVSLPLLRLKLLNEFTRRWLDDDGVQWRFQLVGTTPPTIAGYNSDQAESGDDKLDVSRFATAFAVVLAADSVRPPLSIGIFGDWGSGKSFFMRLMTEATDKVCALDTAGPDGRRLFCRRVVPIRFNAWHYAERNLWASLVQTIFRELRTALVGKNEESELMETVLNRLEVAKVARKEAEAQVAKAQKERDATEKRVKTARDEADRKANEAATVKTTDVIHIVRQEVLTKARFEQAVKIAETHLGVTGFSQLAKEGDKTGADVIDFVNQTQVTAARARSAIDWLARAPVNKEEILVLCGVSAAVLALGGGAAFAFRDQISSAWPMVSAAIVEVLTVAGVVTNWAKKHLSSISQGLDEFDSLRNQIDRKVAEQRAVHNKQVEEAEQQAAQATSALARAESDLRAAEEQVRKAEQQVKDSGSLNRIAKLVEQRLTGRDYEQYLGIVDAIRKDFQTLSTLMKELGAKGSADPGLLQPLDRIVLYIDDLDRCPPRQVVAVLEAIHLLLTFELFVVVVAVDVRWAAHSLAEQYPRQLAPGRYESEDGRDAPQRSVTPAMTNRLVDDGATALDYLEKIFQIPFWLPPMDEQSSRNMIADMLPRPREQGNGTPVVTGIVSSAEPAPAAAPGSASKSTPVVTGPILSRNKAESLVIEPSERSFILSLAGAVGKSPRRLKRFVNTYRILKGSIDALERETFVLNHGTAGEYRAAATLLAVITGAPNSSLALARGLAGSTDDSKAHDFVSAAKALAAPAEWPYVDEALKAYVKATNNPQLTLRDLRYWMPRVMRFSFRSGRN